MGLKNKSLADEWLTDDALLLVNCWARDGIYMQEIANRIGISSATLSQWRNKYPLFDEALRTGKEIVDYKVENALLKAALGFTTKEIKVTIGRRQINGQWVDVTKETTTKEVAPNVTAALAWLNNRKPEKWKRNRDLFFNEEDTDANLKVTIVRGPQKDAGDTEDNTNKEIMIEKVKNDSGQSGDSGNNKENDKDYWPDDWEE